MLRSGNLTKCRKLIGLTLSALLVAGLFSPSHAEAVWPPKTVRIIVPFGAGSTPDMVGRMLSDSLQARFPHSTFVVENKPGASGNIGTDAVARATPDGSTLGISVGGPLAINTLLFAKLPYNPDTDLAPISMLTQMPNVLAVPADLGVNTVSEFLTRVKGASRGLAYGSIGVGSLSQLSMEAIAQKAGAKMVHIPYAGSPNAVTALLRGDVQAASLAAIAITPHIPSGKIKILAVTTAQRSPFLPDVPTLIESGVNVQSDAWNALIAPGGTPDDIIYVINAEVRKTLTEPAVIEKLKVQLVTPAPSTPAELRKRIAEEKGLWADVIKAANIHIE